MPEETALTVEALDDLRDVQGLVSGAREAAKPLSVDLSGLTRIYPCGAVSFAAAFAFFGDQGKVLAGPASTEASRTHVLDPQHVTSLNLSTGPITHVVWVYEDEREAGVLCNRFVDVMAHTVRCEKGVLDSLNWCLYEVMDNVFQHGETNRGFAMMQIHRKNRLCVISVGDHGIGVHRSFIEGGTHRPPTAEDALKLAIQERATSKVWRNRGNGLFGLHRVVALNGGSMAIHSGRSTLETHGDKQSLATPAGRRVLAPDNHGTVVDWRLDASHPVSLSEALGTPDPATPFIEQFEDDSGRHMVKVSDFEESLGSRFLAQDVRTNLQNLLEAGVPRLTLDFSGIYVVSSSFADEVVGKLAAELGESEFFRRFDFFGATATVEGLLKRAISQRLDIN